MPDRIRRATVVVNKQSGTVLENSRKDLEQQFRDAFATHGVDAEVRFVKARDLGSTMADASDADDHLLVVAGGDGSINAVLEAMENRRGPTAILPLGTLNLLARDLGMQGVISEDVARIASASPQGIDLVDVNGHRFHSIAGFGFFAVMAVQREHARRRFPFSRAIAYAWATIRALVISKPITVEIEVDGERRSLTADAVLVTNNRFDGTPWRRERLDAGHLEVHLVQLPRRLDRLKAVLAVARGRWREMPQLTTVAAGEVTLHRPGRRRRFLSVDGELRRFASPLHFRCLPKAATLHVGMAATATSREPEPAAG